MFKFVLDLLNLQDTCSEGFIVGVSSDDLKRIDQRLASLIRVDNPVDPQPSSGVANIGGSVIGGLDFFP